MILYPQAKINLGLRIVGRRPDGYHDLETVFFPVGWSDILEMVPAGAVRYDVRLTMSGLPVAGRRRDNLVVRAARLLQERHGMPAVRFHLHKQVPAGAGLGGGSADAAATLQGLNTLFALGLDDDELAALALILGSDVSFFLHGRPAVARGRGEVLEPLALDLRGYHLLIVFPGLHLDTAEMFRRTLPGREGLSPAAAVTLPPAQWRGRLVNDFQTTAVALAPAIGEIVEKLYDAGAVYASLSGSGSAVYGLFVAAPPRLTWPAGYLTWHEEIR